MKRIKVNNESQVFGSIHTALRGVMAALTDICVLTTLLLDNLPRIKANGCPFTSLFYLPNMPYICALLPLIQSLIQ